MPIEFSCFFQVIVKFCSTNRLLTDNEKFFGCGALTSSLPGPNTQFDYVLLY